MFTTAIVPEIAMAANSSTMARTVFRRIRQPYSRHDPVTERCRWATLCVREPLRDRCTGYGKEGGAPQRR